MYQKIVKILLVCLFVWGQAQGSSLDLESDFDSSQYLGKWYEIARLPNDFQTQCEKNISASYQLNEEGIAVLNSCVTKESALKEAMGQAYKVNENGSQLKVSFLPQYLRWIPFTKGDYWILKLDPSYQVSLVGDPQKKYLWLLSRTPALPQSIIDEYLEFASSYGYQRLDQLIYTKQD